MAASTYAKTKKLDARVEKLLELILEARRARGAEISAGNRQESRATERLASYD